MAYTCKSVKDLTYSDGRCHITLTVERDGKNYAWDDNVDAAAYDADHEAVVGPLITQYLGYVDAPPQPTATPVPKIEQIEKTSDQVKIDAKLAVKKVEG